MKKDTNILSCAEFQAQLPELIGSGEQIAEHPHLRSCELCRALLADLETIAEAAASYSPLWNRQTNCGNRSNRPSKTRKAGPIGAEPVGLPWLGRRSGAEAFSVRPVFSPSSGFGRYTIRATAHPSLQRSSVLLTGRTGCGRHYTGLRRGRGTSPGA